MLWEKRYIRFSRSVFSILKVNKYDDTSRIIDILSLRRITYDIFECLMIVDKLTFKSRLLIVMNLADTLIYWHINSNIISIFVRIDACDAHCSSVKFIRNHIYLIKQIRANEIIRTMRFTTLLSWSYVVKRYIIRTELLVKLIIEKKNKTRIIFFFYLVIKISITSFALSLFDSRLIRSAISIVKI